MTGDAYVDHPSFGAALIGRYLESLGYRVGILAQPDWKSAEEFRRFGRPRLFFGVTAGNLDSMVANYTPDRRRAHRDAYSPGERAGQRPDLASVVYAQRCREAYPDAVVVLGGIEASLRRFAHYDFVQQKVRGSVLADAKADFLVYGMGERAVAALAAGLAAGKSPEDCARSAAWRTWPPRRPKAEEVDVLPSADEAIAKPETVLRVLPRPPRAPSACRSPRSSPSPTASGGWSATPPAEPLSPEELDALYRLPFARAYPERYEALGGVPALTPVNFSLVTHRGCYGGCSFCAISAHQGKAVVSRTAAGVRDEAARLAARPDFAGTIQDVGGPTANMYGTHCRRAGPGKSGCARPQLPRPRGLPRSGGLRRPLPGAASPGAQGSGSQARLRRLRACATTCWCCPPSGGSSANWCSTTWAARSRRPPSTWRAGPCASWASPPSASTRNSAISSTTLKPRVRKERLPRPLPHRGPPRQHLEDAVDLARFVKRLGHFVEQVQQFTPTPMTASSCMYWSRRDPDTGETVFAPSGAEAKIQKALAQFQNPRNREKLQQYFGKMGKGGLLVDLYGRPAPRRKGASAPKTFADRSGRAIIKKRPRRAPGGGGRSGEEGA